MADAPWARPNQKRKGSHEVHRNHTDRHHFIRASRAAGVGGQLGHDVMNELAKLRKIIGRECPDSSVETLLVLDGTTGQNALSQARAFSETAGITGIVLTKLDGTAKGGVVISISHTMGIPVKYIGIGEKIDDLVPFDPADFVRALF